MSGCNSCETASYLKASKYIYKERNIWVAILALAEKVSMKSFTPGNSMLAFFSSWDSLARSNEIDRLRSRLIISRFSGKRDDEINSSSSFLRTSNLRPVFHDHHQHVLFVPAFPKYVHIWIPRHFSTHPMTDSKAEEKAVASGSGANDSKGGNDLLLRFFQSEWFTPAVPLLQQKTVITDNSSCVSRIWSGISII